MKYQYHHTSCPSMTSMTGDYAKCEFQCLWDYDCPTLHYCCPNGCGRLCVPAQAIVEDDCGCSVTFFKPEDGVFGIPLSVQNLVWEALGESFTPSLEPYIVKGDFNSAFIGSMDSQCNFKRFIEFGPISTRYNAFKKPQRILIIIADDAKFLEEVSLAPLNVTFTTVCAITAQNFSIGDSLMEQLSVTDNDQPCLWTVDSFSNLRDAALNISTFVSAASCNCGGETIPSSPCKEEGATCEKDSECDQPTLVCTKGKCTRVTCFEPETFNPKPSLDYNEYTYYDFHGYYYVYGFPGDNFYASYFGFYEDYDYYYLNVIGRRVSAGSSKMKRHQKKHSSSKISTGKQRKGHDKQIDREKTSTRQLLTHLVYNKIDCCDFGDFQCSGVPTICIPGYKVCDGIGDCFHGDDETPESCAKRICDKEWFKCTSGPCLDVKQTCDGIQNCPDGSDEFCLSQSDCPSPRSHYCASGECIHTSKFCDKVQDCLNGEDEIHCRCTGFRCSPLVCIGYDKVCDGTYDCLDGSDEYCANSSCPKKRPFLCQNGICISKKSVCNGQDDCGDRSDEDVALCKPESCFYCGSGECVLNTTVCDGMDDCSDRSDEMNCKTFECRPNIDKYLCNSGECLSGTVRCNGREECADGSDELLCDTCPDSRPLLCSSGECIDYKKVCDGRYDCSDKADESKCLSMKCPANRYKCNSGQCVTFFGPCHFDRDVMNSPKLECNQFLCKSGDCVNRCDGYRECEDGSDEEDCEGMPCPQKKHWRCKSGECIPVYLRCDGFMICNDGSDEENCQDYKCPPGDIKCGSGECFAHYGKCNYLINCNDGSDERDCKQTMCYGAKEMCESGDCINSDEFCDGFQQCFDSSDEEGCQNYKCPSDRPFQCKSGTCKREKYKCDGFISCDDGSDEEDCQNYTCPPYRPYSCPSGICITFYQLCNGVDDCGDGSDELDCANNKCPDKAFKCNKGNCIPPRRRCNNKDDCDDGEDELDCENYVFQCKYNFACVAQKKCIPAHFLCDGDKMCSDGSDEKDCPPNGS